MLRQPYILGDPQRQAPGAKSEVAPNKGEQNHKWLPHPCLLGGPKEGGNAMSPPTFLGISNANRSEQNQKWPPTKGGEIRIGCLTPAFSGAQKKAEMPRLPCIHEDPQ